ncbi:hypothetical protein CLV58_13326 [Spirosoma oryzae]|uniref:Uncharacterized protein n=1 Tax=Spirosoma oryzae TaxID=1469603 RepID=A0A2T0S242_9BACT|nr:hypothetical protein CLV58_13326 [Spirosoma oryzae]
MFANFNLFFSPFSSYGRVRAVFDYFFDIKKSSRSTDRLLYTQQNIDHCWPDYKLPFFISFTAKSAARAVSAIYVSDGFTHEADVIQAPSVLNTFLTA